MTTITERTLRKWRKEALEEYEILKAGDKRGAELRNRILKMTQELLDQHLMRRKE